MGDKKNNNCTYSGENACLSGFSNTVFCFILDTLVHYKEHILRLHIHCSIFTVWVWGEICFFVEICKNKKMEEMKQIDKM